jgi:exopolyphosphatase / guanosine-5'-triphosphate,3'-diphosphate pyrophosphatase
MSKARFAVVDLGTNTFHVLIVESSGNSWNELYRERIFVNLAEGGIAFLSDKAQERGLNAIRHFSNVIDDHNVDDTVAVGTAALRNAANSDEFIGRVKDELDIAIQVIDGETEARYINAGVMKALPPRHNGILVMDIGGGSVEFILSINREHQYSVSYPIGVAVLFDAFHKSEPIAPEELEKIDQFLDVTLRDLSKKIESMGQLELVGASGTFEVINSALQKRLAEFPFSSIERRDLFQMYDHVVPMTYAERLADPDIPDTRARYIVVALKLVQHVLCKYEISNIGVSRYALKEGIVAEWSHNLD